MVVGREGGEDTHVLSLGLLGGCLPGPLLVWWTIFLPPIGGCLYL